MRTAPTRSSLALALASTAAGVGVALLATSWTSAAVATTELPDVRSAALESGLALARPVAAPMLANEPLADPDVARGPTATTQRAPGITRTLHASVWDSRGRPYSAAWRLVLHGPDDVALDLGFAAGSPEVEVALAPGRWTLVAQTDQLCAYPLDIVVDSAENSAEACLFLRAATQVRGTVLDGAGAPVDGLRVALRTPEGERVAAATTDGAGAFRFAAIPEGNYELRAGRDASPLRPTRLVEVRGDAIALEPLQIPVLAESTVRVVGADGEPIADAVVEGAGTRGGGFSGLTASDGTYVARFLPPGRYQVAASRTDLGVGAARVEISAGSAVETAIRLRR